MACLRLKRLLTEDPAEAVVVSHKRRCLESRESNRNVEIVFKYFGTVQSKDENVETHLAKAIDRESGIANKRRSLAYTVDAVKKCKVDANLTTKQNRFQLVCTLRGIANGLEKYEEQSEASTSLEETVKGLCRLYDAENCEEAKCALEKASQKASAVITCNGIPLQCENLAATDEVHVYDLYYSNAKNCADEELLENPIRIDYCAMRDELVYDNVEEDGLEENEADDDSNDESNWRNDYPDDEDDFENEYNREDDHDISEQMAAFSVASGRDNGDSSDDDIDSEDERRFGQAYAKFRARIKSKMQAVQGTESDEHGGVNKGFEAVLANAKKGNPFAW